MYLTKDEWNVLWKKYYKEGCDPEQINERLQKIKEHLKKMMQQNKAKGMSDENINLRFKEEFARMIEMDELMIKKKGRRK